MFRKYWIFKCIDIGYLNVLNINKSPMKRSLEQFIGQDHGESSWEKIMGKDHWKSSIIFIILDKFYSQINCIPK